ncbi:MAG: response regulator transcription factor [Caldilinea sp.]
MESPKIRIIIADDFAIVRTGLMTLMKEFDELEFVGQASNGQIAIELCEQISPDLMLMDMQMPVLDGIAATRIIHQRHPDIKIIMLTAYAQEAMVHQALQAGATGYVFKDISPDRLLQTIRSVFAGQLTLSPLAAKSLLDTSHAEHEVGYRLTAREREVLHLMRDGFSNHTIAERLQVSPATVKSHVSNILAKLEVSTRAEAVALTTRHDSHP